ncbi:DUF1003 domain-containing protein [Serratia sp. M24T3]|uniref:DUF1003 domain-containing protein n=1 Tax=Rouxiella sp. WC2420 TaxID=3234145 RepID=A0AB39VWW5_9GAMM|nr:DUF1003 domain-containing protein [Serratia sp. M24T3]EIC84055.1 hypothetical protein SPM24T3_14110 [Serratia sp. M24T3]
MKESNTGTAEPSLKKVKFDHLRFHRKHHKLLPTFGESWFALKAEAFARFFGTPLFLGGQTAIVILWVAVNELGWVKFDIYPFILLNLAFSLQSAYAAPLILLAQTRQAERDKANAEADALHREDLAHLNDQRLETAARQNEQMLHLLQQNTELTTLTKQLTERVEHLTIELHKKLMETKET